ncbi:MAG: hypothetical protein V4578_24210 [Pseudomonadota bacterium]
MTQAPLRAATRRMPITFDENGEPGFDTVCSPKSFQPRAFAVVPPRHVIPVIFVPGIMGTNLRATKEANPQNAPAWRPPNGTLAGLKEVGNRSKQKPQERQSQMTAARTEVDSSGKVELPEGVLTLTNDEAVRRGWGALHFDSYGHVLAELERSLNDQYEDAGKPGAKKMAVWEVAQTLRKKAPIEPCPGEGDPCWRPELMDVTRVWNAVKGTVKPLTDDEFTRLDDFYYPVWAYGYNWLDSNEVAADGLVKRIDEVLSWYDKTKYFTTQGKVIVVTHSMGGIVARRAAQKDASKILGVVHGVQPTSGAPVVYRRFRAGTEVGSIFNIMGAATAVVIGWDAADITCVMANSPGALELLPTKNYPPGWLTVSQAGHRGRSSTALCDALPRQDPYSEIYAKRAQDVWWGMIDETLIDPTGLVKASGRNMTPFQVYKETLEDVRLFHDTLGLYCHPNTYAHYGSDHDEHSFGRVHWQTNDYVQGEWRAGLMQSPASSWNLTGQVTVGSGSREVKFQLLDKLNPEKDDDDDAGDGTVPAPSGAAITKADGAQCVFRMKGFDHQGSYVNRDVIENVMYCIGKIVQKATPAKDLPSSPKERAKS